MCFPEYYYYYYYYSDHVAKNQMFISFIIIHHTTVTIINRTAARAQELASECMQQHPLVSFTGIALDDLPHV